MHALILTQKLMKRIAVIFWNLILIGISAVAAMALLPKIRGQFAAVDRVDMGPLRDWTAAMGYIGIGLLLGVVFSALSLSSPCWGRIARGWRVVFGIVYLAFACGVMAVIGIERHFVGSVSFADYLTFLAVTGLFLLPPVVLGAGIPYITWSRIAPLLRKERSAK